MTYQPYDYAAMTADPVRMGAYVRALQQTVRPGDTVLDLGCGTGVMSIVAAKLGAKAVYAVDPNPSVELVQRMAADNECLDQIHPRRGDAQTFDLPERVDLIVSDLRGVIPLFGKSLEILIDARDRFLKPTGLLVPQRDTLYVALASVPEMHAKLIRPWGDFDYGVSWKSLSGIFSGLWANRRIPPNSLVSSPQQWVELDYRTITSVDVSNQLHFVADRDCDVHGFFLWFDCELTSGVDFSGGPGSELKVYGSAFFPWPESVSLSQGDEVQIELSAKLVGAEYIWSWRTSVGSLNFNQSSMAATFWSLDQLRKRSADFSPTLSVTGNVDLHILERMKAGRPLKEIAKSVCEHFPQQYKTEAQALGHVGKLSSIYST